MKNIPFFLKINKLFDKIIYYLIILLPLSLITGPLLSELSITIIVILFIYISLKNKLFFFYNNIFSKIFGLFFIVLIISSLLSIDPIISLSKTIFYFRFWIFSLSVWYIIEKEHDIFKNLIISLTLSFIILIFDGYVQFLFKKNILGWPIHGSRVSSFFKDELILGSYLSRLLPLLFGLLVYNKNFDRSISGYIFFLVIFIGVETLTFLSGERLAFFYINFSAIFLIVTMKKYKIFRSLSILFSVILIIFIVSINPKSFERMISKTIKQFNWNAQSGSVTTEKYIFSYEHHNHFTSALKMYNDYKIFGVGPRMFRQLCSQKKYITSWESCSTHPHNNYVQLLSETGIIGFSFLSIIFLYLIYIILKHIFFKYRDRKYIYNDFQLSLISCIMISIWPFVPTGGFFNNWLSIIYFFPVGFLLYSLNKYKI